jgi:hypothetical protein
MYLSWCSRYVTIEVLTVTRRFFCGPEYWRMMVKVSSMSLSTPRLDLKKPVTDVGVPKRWRAWSIVCVPLTH